MAAKKSVYGVVIEARAWSMPPRWFLYEVQAEADKTWLPMTVYSTTDPDMPWMFTINGGRLSVSKPYTADPIVTVLPTRYFQ